MRPQPQVPVQHQIQVPSQYPGFPSALNQPQDTIQSHSQVRVYSQFPQTGHEGPTKTQTQGVHGIPSVQNQKQPCSERGFAKDQRYDSVAHFGSRQDALRSLDSGYVSTRLRGLVSLGDLLTLDLLEHEGNLNSGAKTRAMSPMSLIDLDPVPVTTVAGGRGTETAATQFCNLQDVFAPEAASASPFVPPPPPGISEGPAGT